MASHDGNPGCAVVEKRTGSPDRDHVRTGHSQPHRRCGGTGGLATGFPTGSGRNRLGRRGLGTGGVDVDPGHRCLVGVHLVQLDFRFGFLPAAQTVFRHRWSLIVATLVWWALPSLLQMRLPRRWHDRLAKRWGTVKTEEAKNHRGNQIVLSGLRYAVFATQFACAVAAWGGAFSWETYGTIAVVYLGNMVVPTAALAELGVREALIVAWAQPVGDALPALVAASLCRLGGQPRFARARWKLDAIQAPCLRSPSE